MHIICVVHYVNCKFLCVYTLLMWRSLVGLYICMYISNSPKKEWLGGNGMCVYNRIMEGKGGRLLCCAYSKGRIIHLPSSSSSSYGTTVSFWSSGFIKSLWDDGDGPALTCWITFSFRLNIFLSPLFSCIHFFFLFFLLLFILSTYIYIIRRMKWGEADIIGSNGDFFFFLLAPTHTRILET